MSFERGPPRTDLTVLSRIFSTDRSTSHLSFFSDFGTRFPVNPIFGRIVVA
jgi:hypothetical protein